MPDKLLTKDELEKERYYTIFITDCCVEAELRGKFIGKADGEYGELVFDIGTFYEHLGLSFEE
jgi:hypothetical protein